MFKRKHSQTQKGGAGSGGLVTSADMRCRFGLFGPVNVWSYPTFPPPIQSELFDTDSESDPAQRQQMPGAFKPPAPKRPCGIRAYKTPARPRWGLCFVCREDAHHHRFPNVCQGRISHWLRRSGPTLRANFGLMQCAKIPATPLSVERMADQPPYVVGRSCRFSRCCGPRGP